MARLTDAVTIITGAAGGIGRATAVLLAAEGARVGITDLNADLLDETAEIIRTAGGEVVTTVGDIVAPQTIDALTRQVLQAFGHVDGLVNNAGIVLPKPVLDYTLEDFDKILHVNTWSYLVTAKCVVPEELAPAILFMVSQESSFMTGAAMSVDGGWSAW